MLRSAGEVRPGAAVLTVTKRVTTFFFCVKRHIIERSALARCPCGRYRLPSIYCNALVLRGRVPPALLLASRAATGMLGYKARFDFTGLDFFLSTFAV